MPMWWQPILLGIAAAVVAGLAFVLTKTPRQDRDWQPHLARTASVSWQSPVAEVAPVRDWTYRRLDGPPDRPEDAEAGIVSRGWIERVDVEPERLSGVWLLVEPHPGLPLMAHTLVLFEFQDGGLVGLTIEARKERGERFAPFRGLFNKYELAYVWATPRDLLSRRAVLLQHELYLYRLDLTAAEGEAYLRALLRRTEALHARPRFYNTLTSNCTNELAKTAGLAWDPAFVLTGRAAEALHQRGRIAGASFEAVKAGARITDAVSATARLSNTEFNRSLLTFLRGERDQAVAAPPDQ